MKKILSALMMSPLFTDIDEAEAIKIVKCFDIREEFFPKGSFILHQGELAKGIGVVITGALHIVKDDFLGNRDIMTEVTSGDIFNEVYAVLKSEPQGISAVTIEDCRIAFISIDKVMNVCTNGCEFHNTIMKNMVRVLASKNLMLTRKMEHMSKRTIKEKIISYLSEQSVKNGKMDFYIPFNRQQLADYLAVERSALSRELGKLQKEGILKFYKNRFILYNDVD